MSVASVSGLTYTYPGSDEPALCGLDLEIDAGELVVVAGLSGSGKTTLLRALSGLVPHFHGGTFGGTVEVMGMDTREHGPSELAGRVGTLFQDPETQILLGTPRAELAFPLENRGWPAAGVARAVEETALALAAEALLDRSVDSLSGGELQRVALGATLAGRPALVCLDEPTSQLDPVAADELIGLLRRLNDDADLTVVMADHRLERCLPIADRVLALVHGRIGFDGPPGAFLRWAVACEPALATPGAQLLDRLGLEPVPGVKRARAALRAAGFPLDPGAQPTTDSAPAERRAPRRARQAARRGAALEFRNVWHEPKDGKPILRNLNLRLAPGERIALMGRNGAGKSTLLRHAASLMRPTRGAIKASGRIALLLQHPGDYLVHETVRAELGGGSAALARFDLAKLADRHPGDLSGGDRQRVALSVVLGGDSVDPPAVVCLDEPTRGMDRRVRVEVTSLITGLETAVLVATHDPEFAAAFADRVILLADGTVIADGPASEILCGGTYFATETARILGGTAGTLLPEQGERLLREQSLRLRVATA